MQDAVEKKKYLDLPRLSEVLRKQSLKALEINNQNSPCPFCQGTNRECGFLTTKMDSLPEIPMLKDEERTALQRVRLEQLISSLEGQIVRFIVDDQEYDLDLGKHCRIVYRSLFLGPSKQGNPLLDGLIHTGFKQSDDSDMEIIFPVLLLEYRQTDLTELDDDAQSEIMNRIQDERAKQGYPGELVWTRVEILDGKVKELSWAMDDRMSNDKTIGLLDQNRFYRLEELIYRHWADLEERWWRQMESRDLLKTGFLCSDMPKLWADFGEESQAIRSEVLKEMESSAKV